MKIEVRENVTVVTDAEGNIYVTRPGMHGRINTHRIATKEYTPEAIAGWLRQRSTRFIQDIFPEMSAEDREFLMSGITPTEWNAMFGEDE